MPPRSIVAAVLLFWLGANSWLVYREVRPRWRSGEPPPYTIDLTEELGHTSVNWEIWKKHKRIGNAVSRVERQRDRTYKLNIQFYFDKFRIVILDVRKITGAYHVTEDGELLGLSAFAGVAMKDKLGTIEMDLEMKGRVADGMLLAEVFFDNKKVDLGELKIPLAGRGAAINPLHPLNRLPGLTEGRRWKITLFDPLDALMKAKIPQLDGVLGAMEGMAVRELLAEVKSDTLVWDGTQVDCFKIEYRVPGEEEPVAATWVRRRDGLVLQQHSSNGLSELTLRRSPTR
jgi:hypothetical protein